MFDRYDICEAYYLFGALYHGGQFTKEYAYMGRVTNIMKLRPRLTNSLSPNDLSENGRDIYNALIERNGLSAG